MLLNATSTHGSVNTKEVNIIEKESKKDTRPNRERDKGETR